MPANPVTHPQRANSTDPRPRQQRSQKCGQAPRRATSARTANGVGTGAASGPPQAGRPAPKDAGKQMNQTLAIGPMMANPANPLPFPLPVPLGITMLLGPDSKRHDKQQQQQQHQQQ